MNEFELIRKLTDGVALSDDVKVGPGDDCAVLDLGVEGTDFLFKTDAVVQSVHFNDEATPEQIGHKAIGRVLSDIAAMGGRPMHALVTLGLAADFDVAVVEGIYRGMRRLGDRFGVGVVGGETTSSPGGAFLSIAMLGRVPAGRALLRSGAKEGDAVFVTGELGGSLGGRHLEFEPRIEEASWLRENFSPHAMIDLSDGLAGDLKHILRASGCAAEIFGDAVPVSRAAKLRAREGSAAKPALLAALTDGEDFELLFTLPARDAVCLLDAWKPRFPDVRLGCVGKVLAGRGLKIRTETGVRELSDDGYLHFQ